MNEISTLVIGLSDAHIDLARRDAAKPLTVNLWAGWCGIRNGWCVYRNYANLLHCDLLAGPFDTREEAEARLGAKLNWVPRGV